jgi:LTXXQ motif family protein
MNNRLDAMAQATKTLRPTLAAFYASLSDEQKAQFNSMGQQTAD